MVFTKICELLKREEYSVLQGSDCVDINSVEYDSRKVKEGSVFVCILGLTMDGHNFINSAIKNGAKAVVVQKDVSVLEGITCIKVKNTRHTLAIMSAEYYGKPASKMRLIGVTGTNGKTTTTYIIKSILEKAGRKTGVIGTIQNCIGDKIIHADRTTPESLELHGIFKYMVDEEVNDVIMEVSSHSLDLNRVDGCNFDLAIFTNLTEDHLDYHKTMENYRDAKSILFGMCNKAVINIDDPYGEYMHSKAPKDVITTGIENEKADMNAFNLVMKPNGVEFDINFKQKSFHLVYNVPGKFSVYNALGAFAAGVMLGIDFDTILSGIAAVKGVKGRFEPIKTYNDITAVVDYSHTPDSLKNMLNTAREFVRGRIITVFGCGGDRDKFKRPIMGEIAGQLSDFCIITSDNPRSENPQTIIDEIEPGTAKTGCEYVKIADRREAIFYAVKMAKPNDFIGVAGKGHEDYQVFADRTVHFDDAEVLLEAFKEIEK